MRIANELSDVNTDDLYHESTLKYDPDHKHLDIYSGNGKVHIHAHDQFIVTVMVFGRYEEEVPVVIEYDISPHYARQIASILMSAANRVEQGDDDDGGA